MLEVTDLATVTKKVYEGMFLVDTALAAADWGGVIKGIESILKRVEAEVVSLRKWDERRLAYDVDKVSRGTYILVYFKCDGEKIQEIEKTVQLSEKIMRVLILNAEHMTQDDIEKDTPATKAEKIQEEREAAVQAKVEEAKAAEKAAAKSSEDAKAAEKGGAKSSEEAKGAEKAAAKPSEDAPAVVEVKAVEEATEPVEKQDEAEAEQPAEATASSEAPAAEASGEASKDESKAAE